MGGVIPPDPEVFGVVLCGRHRYDGWSSWVPREVIQAGCVTTEEDGEPVEVWEADTDRTVVECPIVVRHWHTDGGRTAQGIYRFHLVEDDATP